MIHDRAYHDTPADTFDTSRVSIMGVSLGAITGGNFAALANTSMGGDLAALDGMFAIKQASLESPGGGAAQFLIESPSFGPLIKGLLLSQASDDFVALLNQLFETTDVNEAQLVEAVALFEANLTEAQAAAVNAVFAEFAFAAQTVMDSGDPTNYAQTLGSNTPVHMMTVVGDGSAENLPDQVIPVSTALPLSGQLPLANIIGLEQVSTTVGPQADPISGLVLFNSGAHASSLSPASNAAVTAEMQRQVATYVSSDAGLLPISDESVVAN